MFTLLEEPILDENSFADMVSFAWQALGAGEISRDASLVDAASIEQPLRAVISISAGEAQSATLAITADEALARHFADQLLQLGDDLEAEDIDDAFGELANVVGGNVKGLISDGSVKLSIPAVSREPVPAADGVITISCGFTSAGMSMTWELFEVNNVPAASGPADMSAVE